MNRKDLGQRLRNVRESKRITQQRAAEVLEIPRTAVARIESGDRTVSTLELARFAELYDRPIAEFFEESPQDEDLAQVLFRAFPQLDQDDIRDAVDSTINLCREGMELERLLGWNENAALLPIYDLTPPRSAYEAVQQGLVVAAEERKRMGISDSPIADMSDLIFDQGIWATGAMLPDEVSGIFLNHASMGIAIIVNYAHNRRRKRFSYAHEYGHAIMDRARGVFVSSRENAGEMMEKRANAFAAALLMPASGVRRLLRKWKKNQDSRQRIAFYDVAEDDGKSEERRAVSSRGEVTYRDIANVARHFHTSYQAATWRLKSLTKMTEEKCKELLEQEPLGREYLEILDGCEAEESVDRDVPDRELVGQVARLAIEAFRRGEISRGRLLDLAKKLDKPADTLLKLAEST